MLKDSFTYAARSLTKRRLRSWLTIIGVFIGIAAVVALISLGQGLERAVVEEFSSLGTDRLTVSARGGGFGPPGLGAAVALDETDLRVVQRAQYVEAAAGRIIRPATLTFGQDSLSAFVATFPDDRDERAVVERFFNPEVTQGRFLEVGESGSVAVGRSVANNARLSRPIDVGRTIQIENESFRVIGVLTSTGNPQFDQAIFMNEADARRALNIPTEYSIIVAQATSTQEVPLARESIEHSLRRHRGVRERQEDFSVQTPQDILNTFQTILGVITGVLVGIALISLFVGGVGIMNTMYTAVVERKREIGIMKAVGATNERILTLFLIESGLIGLTGAAIGVALGAGFAKAVELIAAQVLGPSVLVASTPLWLVFGSLAFGFIVGTLSGVWPARRAARLPPVEALR